MQIEGLNYLLAKPDRGAQFVSRYLESEMDELFTADERAALDRGEAITRA